MYRFTVNNYEIIANCGLQQYSVDIELFECMPDDFIELYMNHYPQYGQDTIGFVLKKDNFHDLKTLFQHPEGDRYLTWSSKVLDLVQFHFEQIWDIIGFRISGKSFDIHKFIVDAKLKESNDVMKDVVIPSRHTDQPWKRKI